MILQALRAAEQAGLKVMFGLFAEMNVAPWDNTTEFLNASSLVNESSPALWGWLLADEPNQPDTIRSLARLKSKIDEVRPGHLSFVNLLPNYGNGPPWHSYEECPFHSTTPTDPLEQRSVLKWSPVLLRLLTKVVICWSRYVDFYIETYKPQVRNTPPTSE